MSDQFWTLCIKGLTVISICPLVTDIVFFLFFFDKIENRNANSNYLVLKWQRILVYPFYRKTEFASFCFNDTKHIIWLYSYKNPFIIAEGHPCFPNVPILHMSNFQLQHSFHLIGFNPFHFRSLSLLLENIKK